MNSSYTEISQFIDYYIFNNQNGSDNKKDSKTETKESRNNLFCSILNDENKIIEFAKNIQTLKIETLVNILDENIVSNPIVESIDKLAALYAIIEEESTKTVLINAILKKDDNALIYLYNNNFINEDYCIEILKSINDNKSRIYFTGAFNKFCGEIIITPSITDTIYEIEHLFQKNILENLYNHINTQEELINVLKHNMKYNLKAKSVILNNFVFLTDIFQDTEIEPIAETYTDLINYIKTNNIESAQEIIKSLDIKLMPLLLYSMYYDKGLEIILDKIKLSDLSNCENELAYSLVNIIEISSNKVIISKSIELLNLISDKLNNDAKTEVCKIIDIDLNNINQQTGKKIIDLIKEIITVTDEYKLIENFDRQTDISNYNYRLLIIASMVYKTGTYRTFLECIDNDEQSTRLETQCKFLLDKKLITSTIKELDNEKFRNIIIGYLKNKDYVKVLKNKLKKTAYNEAFSEWCMGSDITEIKHFLNEIIGVEILNNLNEDSLKIIQDKIYENIIEIDLNDNMLKVFTIIKFDVNHCTQLNDTKKDEILEYYKTQDIKLYNNMMSKSKKEELKTSLKEFDFETVLKFKEEDNYNSIVGDWIKSLPLNGLNDIILNHIYFVEKQSVVNVNSLLFRIYDLYEDENIEDNRIIDNLLKIGADVMKLYNLVNEEGKTVILKYLIENRPGIAGKIYKEKIIKSIDISELNNFTCEELNYLSNDNINVILKLKAYSFIETSIIELSSLDKNYILESSKIAENLCNYNLEKRFYNDNLLMESADKKVLDIIKKHITKMSTNFQVIENYIDSLDVLIRNEDTQGFKEEFENIIDVVLDNESYINQFIDKLIRKEYKKEVYYSVLYKFGKSIIDINNLIKQLKSDLINNKFEYLNTTADYIRDSLTGLERAISREDINEYSRENLSKYIKKLRISLNSIGIETAEDVDLYLKNVKFNPELHQDIGVSEGILETLGVKVNNTIKEYCLLKGDKE